MSRRTIRSRVPWWRAPDPRVRDDDNRDVDRYGYRRQRWLDLEAIDVVFYASESDEELGFLGVVAGTVRV